MAIKKKEEINFDLLIGLGDPPIRINGFDISRDKMPSEEFYSGKHGMCAGKLCSMTIPKSPRGILPSAVATGCDFISLIHFHFHQ